MCSSHRLNENSTDRTTMPADRQPRNQSERGHRFRFLSEPRSQKEDPHIQTGTLWDELPEESAAEFPERRVSPHPSTGHGY